MTMHTQWLTLREDTFPWSSGELKSWTCSIYFNNKKHRPYRKEMEMWQVFMKLKVWSLYRMAL